jgi:3-methyladenine DNA glycosylase/8-oxoguanine DNA glycosylase
VTPAGEPRGATWGSDPAAGDADRIEVRAEVRPPSPFRMPRRLGLDRLARRRGNVVQRLIHRDGEPIEIRAVQLSGDRVLFGGRAGTEELAEWGITRMRGWLGVDLDLRAFHERYRFDPLIGPSVRAHPQLRPSARPDPFEALWFAVCEQLIDYERAATIERRLIARLGRRDPLTGLRDGPAAATIAAQAPALLASMDLTEGRALALRRAAREVASGRVDLHSADPDEQQRGWRRLRAIPGIGSWTVQTLALRGQGRVDQLPAGDLAYLKLVGRLRHEGPPGSAAPRATEDEVARFFAPYGRWAALAALHALVGHAGTRTGAGAQQLAA